MSITCITDFDVEDDRATLWRTLKRLRGRHRVEIARYRKRRSDQQNRRYWGAIIRAFGDFLRENGESITDLQAHELMKHKFLRRTWVDTKTGEAHDYTRSTAELNTAEFTEYMDDCENWLAEFGIIIEEDERFWAVPSGGNA